MADIHQMAGTSLMARAISKVKASYWYADPNSDYPAKYIDSNLFTHLFCAFADLDATTYLVTISCKNLSNFENFTTDVQKNNSHVQTLLSIGGKNADNHAFTLMAGNADYRKTFISSSIDLARANGFYGLDLAWMYPSNNVEMTNLGKLLKEWQSAIQDEAENANKPALLLTASVYNSPVYNSHAYPVKSIAENLDWVNVMSYDFYGPDWSSVTGPPAALYDPSNASGLSGDSGVSQWIAKVPANKVVLGFPYYGWAWTLDDAKNNGYDAATDGAALSPDGSITYEKIRNYIVNNGPATFYDPTVVGHYCYVGTTWIGYDDNQSIVSKVKYAKDKGLLGYFSWHVGADFNCGLSRAASVAWETTETTNLKNTRVEHKLGINWG